MPLTFFSRCENPTLDATHDYSAGDTTGTAQASVSVDPAAARYGTNGILVSGAGGHYRYDSTGLANRLVGAMGCWFRIPSTPGGVVSLMQIRGTNVGDRYDLSVAGDYTGNTGQVRLTSTSTDTGGATFNLSTTGAAPLSANTWYFGAIRWDQPNSRRRLEVYNAALALIQALENNDAFVAPLSLAFSTGLRIGDALGFTVTEHLDNVFLSTTFAEPLVANAAITSYTEYVGGTAPTIADAGDESFRVGETGVVLTVTNAGATQGNGRVRICPSNSIADANGVNQTVTAWGDTEITIDIVGGTLPRNTPLYLFVENDGGLSNSTGYAVQLTPPIAVLAYPILFG